MTIIEALSTNARADANRAAFVFRRRDGSDTAVSRGDLWRRSLAFAARLDASRPTRDEPFIIVLPNRDEMLYAFFGAMIAGMVPAFMPSPSGKQNASLFWETHRRLFALIGARRFLTYRANAELAGVVPAGSTVLFVEDIAEWFRAPDPTELEGPPLPPPTATALLQHTSGTTGLKKGVMLSHRAILRQVEVYAAAIGFGPDDVIASWLPLYHDMGLIACMIMPAVVGARVVLLDPFEWVAKPTQLLDAIERDRATFCWLPNFAFLHLIRTAPADSRWDLSSVKAFINCSEPCKAASLERFAEQFDGCGVQPSALQVCYAMAESVFAVTQTKLGTAPRCLVVDADALAVDGTIAPAADGTGLPVLSCGQPIGEAQVVIRAADRSPLGPRRVGEITIRADFLFSGYNKLPDATAEKLRDGWYYTGDLGFIDADELFVTGRKDDLMIVYGRNYYAHAVEQAASECPGVVPGRTVAFAVENEATGSRDAVLLVEGDGTWAEPDLRRALKTHVLDAVGLTLHSVQVYARGTLIKSTAGKISREHNRRLYSQQTSVA